MEIKFYEFHSELLDSKISTAQSWEHISLQQHCNKYKRERTNINSKISKYARRNFYWYMCICFVCLLFCKILCVLHISLIFVAICIPKVCLERPFFTDIGIQEIVLERRLSEFALFSCVSLFHHLTYPVSFLPPSRFHSLLSRVNRHSVHVTTT